MRIIRRGSLQPSCGIGCLFLIIVTPSPPLSGRANYFSSAATRRCGDGLGSAPREDGHGLLEPVIGVFPLYLFMPCGLPHELSLYRASPRLNSGPISFRESLFSLFAPFGRLRADVISPRLVRSSSHGRLTSQLQSWRVLVTACFMTCGSCFLLNVKSSGRQMIFILVVSSPSPPPLPPPPYPLSSPSSDRLSAL